MIGKIIGFFRKNKKARVSFDVDHIYYNDINGEHHKIKWNNLRTVLIKTTDRGPIEDDLFWMLFA